MRGELVVERADGLEALRRLARLHGADDGLEARRLERGHCGLGVTRTDVDVRDHGATRAQAELAAFLAELLQQAATDKDVITAPAKRDIHCAHGRRLTADQAPAQSIARVLRSRGRERPVRGPGRQEECETCRPGALTRRPVGAPTSDPARLRVMSWKLAGPEADAPTELPLPLGRKPDERAGQKIQHTIVLSQQKEPGAPPA